MNPDNPKDSSLRDANSSANKSPLNDDAAPKRRPEDLSTLRMTRPQGKKEAKYDDLWSFMQENTRETISYVLVIAGILMMFFDSVSIYGSLLVGVVLGLYFSKEIAYLFSHINQLIEEQGTARSLMIGAFLLILLIKIPFLLIGIAAVGALKMAFSATDK